MGEGLGVKKAVDKLKSDMKGVVRVNGCEEGCEFCVGGE